jgi:hypothetical protein
MRRVLTLLVVAAGTAAATSAWLYDGDLGAAVAPLLPSSPPAEWNAAALAEREGIVPAAAPMPTIDPAPDER